MPTSALYQWSVAGSPVNVLIDLQAVDKLRQAAEALTIEVGGLLLGYFDGAYTVITDFETVDSEHRRGAAYTLSTRDQAKLGARIENLRKRNSVVGFFRSHRRAGLYLDEGDNQIISSLFSNSNQVVLLVKPTTDRRAVGGFFFWEEGEMNRKQTYLQFPMSSRELELGDFPLVEPVETQSAAAMAAAVAPAVTAIPVADFEHAETLDEIRPGSEPSEVPRAEAPIILPNRPVRDLDEPRRAKTKLTGPVIGLIAAAAAIGGYVIGTSGSHRDRFGARPGDMSLSTAPEPPPPAIDKPSPSPLPAAKDATPADASSANAPVTAAPETPPAAASSEAASKSSSTPIAAAPPLPAKPTRPAPTVRPNRVLASPPSDTVASNNPPQAPISSPETANPEASGGAGAASPGSAEWQHFHPQPAAVAPAVVTPPPVTPLPVAEASVFLEAVEAGGVSRAMGKIPLFGALHHPKGGDNFVPAQAVHSGAPRVPKDLARELTGPLPVDLKLRVDSTGRVSSIELLSRQTAEEFVRLAGDAAYNWRFEPARIKDKPVSSDVIAHFRFRPVL